MEEKELEPILEVLAKDNLYTVQFQKNTSLTEIAFSMAVIIKVLVRDKHIPNPDTMLELVNKYLTDPQYDEADANDETDTEKIESEGSNE